MNVTAGTMEEMYERAEFAKELGSIIIMIDLTIGYTAIQSMAKWCARERHDPAPPPRGPRHLHPPEDPRRQLPRDRQVVPPDRRRPHPRRHGRRQARGRPSTTKGFYDTLRDGFIPEDPALRASTSTRTGRSMPGVMPVASGGIHAGQMHQLLHYLGEDVVLQFGGGTIGHPMGIAAGATANRVAVEAMIQARNEGRTTSRRARTSSRRRPRAAPSSTRARRSGRTSRSTSSRPTCPTSSSSRPIGY